MIDNDLLKGWIDDNVDTSADMSKSDSIHDLPLGIMSEDSESRITRLEEDNHGGVVLEEVKIDGKEETIDQTVSGQIFPSRDKFEEWKQERITQYENGEIKWLKEKK